MGAEYFSVSLAAAIDGFNQPVGEFLTVLGRARELAVILLLEALAAIGAAYFLASGGADIQTAAYARLAVATMALMRLFYMLRTAPVIGSGDIAMAWLRPCLAALTMYLALWSLQHSIALSPVGALSLGFPLGVFVFAATLFALWYFMKQPQGFEHEVMRRLRELNTS